MVWRVREGGVEGGIKYDSKSEYFTIRNYHGGQFRYLSSEKVYVGGSVNYVDYCHSDEMSLIELELIGRELGCLQTPIYMYKVNGFDLEVGLVEIKTYMDAMKLNIFVDEHGIIDVYIKPTRIEEVDIEAEDSEESEEGSASDNSVSSFDASDPDFNDNLDVETNDDDNMFYENIDHQVEWVGGDMYKESDKRKMVEEGRGEERVKECNHKSKRVDKGKGVEEVQKDDDNNSDTYYPMSDDLRSIIGNSSDEEISYKEKFVEFNVEANMQSPMFKLGMVFNSANDFRQAVRAYAIKNGKQIRFSTNEKHKVRSHFNTFCKSNMLLNNLCECFDANILDAMDKSIITMLEKIRINLIERIHKKRDKMKKCEGLLCPSIQVIMEHNKFDAANWIPKWNGDEKFEVVSSYSAQLKVDIVQKTCCCRKWDLTRIPCQHAISCMNYLAEEPEKYVHNCYMREIFLKTYSNLLNPVNGKDSGKSTGNAPVLPPDYSRQPGRPKRGGIRRLMRSKVLQLRIALSLLRKG